MSTNLTRGEVMVHRTGPAWFGLRASFSIPGVFPPMRTAEGDLLVDGGVLDNMPVGIMRRLFNGVTVVAVDVGSQRDSPGELPDTGVALRLALADAAADPRAATPDIAGIIRVMMRITELGGSDDRPRRPLHPARRSTRRDARLLARSTMVDAGYEAGIAIEAWSTRRTRPISDTPVARVAAGGRGAPGDAGRSASNHAASCGGTRPSLPCALALRASSSSSLERADPCFQLEDAPHACESDTFVGELLDAAEQRDVGSE